jgi:hypothetical protein
MDLRMLIERTLPSAIEVTSTFSCPTERESQVSLSNRYPFDTLSADVIGLCEASKLLVHIPGGHSVAGALASTLDRQHRGRTEQYSYFLVGGSIRILPGTSREFRVDVDDLRSRFSLRASELFDDIAVAGNMGATIAAVPCRTIGIAEELSRCSQPGQLLGQLSPAQLALLGTAFCSPFLSSIPPRSVARLISSANLECIEDRTVLVDYLSVSRSAWLVLSGFAMIESYEFGHDAIVSYVMPGATVGFTTASLGALSAYRVTQRRDGHVISFDAGLVRSIVPNTARLMFGFDAWR